TSRACSPVLAVTTSHSGCRIARSDSRTPISSSTTSTLGRIFMPMEVSRKHATGRRRKRQLIGRGGGRRRSPLNDRVPAMAHGTSPLRPRDAELVHPILENSARRPEQLGGACLVVVGLGERLEDDLALEVVDGRAERLPPLEDLLLD